MGQMLLGHDTEEIQNILLSLDQPLYRAGQLTQWLYQHGVRNVEEITSLPIAVRNKIASIYDIGRSQVVTSNRSTDNTIKLLLKLSDGETIETVGIPYADRFTCCVSTQVGCPISCTFCATGQSGYIRNLNAGEIVDQVLTIQGMACTLGLPLKDTSYRVSHVVFMGMGEPLLNYDATIKSLHIMNEEMRIGIRHLTISTIGFVPGINKLAREKLQINLAVSLHAPTDSLRSALIPNMREWTVKDIITACKQYFQATGRRITFEYCLLRDVNDTVQEAKMLACILRGMNCHINLIPYNTVYQLPYRSPEKATVANFREVLVNAGINVTQRAQRGARISAACGQLRQHEQ